MPKLEHVAIAIAGSDVVKLFESLFGNPVYKVEEVESEDVTTYFIKAGSSKVELVSPVTGNSTVQRFLDRRGPGLHHVALEIRDIDAAFQTAKEMGVRLTSNTVVDGADGKRVFFVHPASAGGVLVEFCEASRPLGTTQTLVIGGTEHPVRMAGREAADRLLIITPADWLRAAERLLAHFEPTHRVAVVETGDEPISFDALADADLSASVVIAFGTAGGTLLRSARKELLPLRSILFDPPSTLLRSETLPAGLLLVVTEPTEEMSSAALRNAVILPKNEATAGTGADTIVDLVLPLIERHAYIG